MEAKVLIDEKTRRMGIEKSATIGRGDNLKDDPDKENRLIRKMCVVCFYVKTSCLSGQAFTESNCILCGTETMSPTTWTNSVCEDCSKTYSVCIKCGARVKAIEEVI